MKKIVIILCTIALAISASAQQFSWPPRSYPSSVPYKVSQEVNYYWGIQQITCIGKSNGGYKFRISGVAGHDFTSSNSIDIFYIVSNNRIVTAGAYVFPKVSKGQKFSFEIVSAFSGYTPADFEGFFIADKRLKIPEETSNQEDVRVTQNNVSTKLSPEQMTASMSKGLYGPVKSVTDNEGLTITFNKLGNIISMKWKERSENVYTYSNPSQYTIDGHGSYKITFADNKRIVTDAMEADWPEHYIFDNQGRLIEAKYMMWPAMATEKYTYTGTERLPSKSTLDHYDEMGTYSYTYLYEYVNVDSHGNWTKRKVNGTFKMSEYVENGPDKISTEKKTYFETRTITYYPEPESTTTSATPTTPSTSATPTAPATPKATGPNRAPTYVGGQPAMKKFFADNAKPRKPAIETAGYGEVIIEFTVTETGEVANAKLKARVSVSMDEEALRLVRMMPKWNPGLINGEPTRMRVQVGLRFFPNQAFRYIKTIVD